MTKDKRHSVYSALVLFPTLLLAVGAMAYSSSSTLRQKILHSITIEMGRHDNACWVKKKQKLVVMGSSCGRYGIVAAKLAKKNNYPMRRVANVAMDAATPFVNYFTYIHREDVLGRADVVYYTIEPWVLTAKYYKHSIGQRALWSFFQWQAMRGVLNLQGGYFTSLRRTFKELDRFRQHGSKKNCKRRPSMRGWKPLAHKPPAERRDPDTFRHAVYDDLWRFGPSDVEIGYLGRLKERIEANGGLFVLVLMPKQEIFNAIYRDKSGYDRALVKKLNQRLGPVHVIGSFDRAHYDLSEKDFKDDIHLSKSGAIKFTEQGFVAFQDLRKIAKRKLKPLMTY